MLNMDTTRRPVRVSDWAAVLDAVFHADANDEQTWLEWKSRLDLRSKEQIATIVAKAIIAFANRDPDRARATVGGIGILVIGMEPGAVHGVQPVDNADLDSLISPYVGADGPVWRPHWNRYRGKPVLIIEVDSPSWGDPPHAFRKEFGALMDGAVFVRKLARSVPADHREVLRLADRRANAPKDDDLHVAFQVDCGPGLSRYSYRTEDLRNLARMLTEELMEPVAEEIERRRRRADGLLGPDPRSPGIESYSGVFDTEPEGRSLEEYVQEVEDYGRRIEATWPELVTKTACHFIRPPVFKVVNRSSRNYHKVLVEMHVPGTADARRYEPDLAALDLYRLLPEAPRKWGPKGLGGFVQGGSVSYLAYPGPVAPSTTVERGAGCTMRFRPVDLRPRQSVVLEDEWSLLLPATRSEPVVARWSATAINADGAPAEGEVRFDFGGEDVDVLRAALRASG